MTIARTTYLMMDDVNGGVYKIVYFHVFILAKKLRGCTEFHASRFRGLLLKPKHTPKPHAKYRGLYLGVWAYNLIAGPLAQSSSFCIFGNRMTKSPAEFNPWSQKNR